MKFWIENGERKRAPKYYASFADSHKDCQRIWNTYYGKLPDYELAHKWTGGDSVDSWLQNFWAAYNR